MNRPNHPAVPCGRLPVGDDTVVAATRAGPCDAFIRPQAVLDDSRAGSVSRPAAASDRPQSLPRGGCGCRSHDGREVLRQTASGAGKEWREVASFVDEVAQVGDPRHAVPSRDTFYAPAPGGRLAHGVPSGVRPTPRSPARAAAAWPSRTSSGAISLFCGIGPRGLDGAPAPCPLCHTSSAPGRPLDEDAPDAKACGAQSGNAK